MSGSDLYGNDMIEKRHGLLTLLFFNHLLRFKEIEHFLSTRTGGFSEFPYQSLNLGLQVGDDPDKVLKNRRRLAEAIGIPLNRFTIARQIHSDNVRIISNDVRGSGSTDHENAIEGTDAMATNVAGICLVILVADCVPMLFFDPVQRAIGVAHAGWKGTLQLIAQKTVMAMEKAFDSLAEDIVVGVGPSIGPCCYKVGPEVISQVEIIFHTKKEYILNESKSGEGYFDLRKANLDQLLHAGIERKNIEMAMSCTCHTSDLFFSYRQQKGSTGRFCAGITLL
jgi:YfiH family protein